MKIHDKFKVFNRYAVYASDGPMGIAVWDTVEELAKDLSNGAECSVEASIDGNVEFMDVTGMAAELFLAENGVYESRTTIDWLIENEFAIPEYVQEWMRDHGWSQDNDDGSDAHHETSIGN